MYLNPDERLRTAIGVNISIMANCQTTGEKKEVKSTDSLEVCPGCDREIGTAMNMCNCMIGKFSKFSN